MIVGEPVREVEIETTEISEVQNAEVRHGMTIKKTHYIVLLAMCINYRKC